MAATPLRESSLGNKGDAADILVPVLFAKTQSFGQFLSQDIAIEHLDAGPIRSEPFFDQGCECAFSSAGDTGQPENEAIRSGFIRRSRVHISR